MTRSFFTAWSHTPGTPGQNESISFVHDMSVAGFTINWPLFIGLLVTFTGLAGTAIGLMLQKYALNKRERMKEEDRPSYFMMKWWWIGFSLFCVGNLVFWSVLALVPQVVLACWQCWAMIITIMLAPVILGEVVTMGKLISVLIIVAGVVWVVMASPAEYEEYTSEQFWAALLYTPFIVITAAMIVFFLVLLVSQLWIFESKRWSAIRFIFIAAIINWYSVLSARCSSGFFLTTVVHDNHHIGIEFWILITCMLLCAALNVHFLNKALEVDKAIFVVPVYEALAISGQILFGIVFFKEFDGLTLPQTLNLSFAIGVVICGVLMTSINEPDTPFLKQVVINEELCGCCFCGFAESDTLSDDDEEKEPLNPDKAEKSAMQEEGEGQRGYRRKQNGQGPRGAGGPRDPRGERENKPNDDV